MGGIIMKYILTFFLVLIGSNIKSLNAEPYSETGHTQFQEIVFLNEDAFLIKQVGEDYIDNELKKLNFKLFGSREKVLNDYQDCNYVSNVIFSRSNKTREEYTFSYDTSKINYQKLSVTVKGTIDLKGVFKLKSKEFTVSGEHMTEKENEEYNKTTEEGRLSVVVYPNKKVTLRIVGEAKVSNGVKKNFVFGICVKKGAWEVISVTSTCYELIEEDA